MKNNTSLFVMPLYLGWAFVGIWLFNATIEYNVFPIAQLVVISHWLSLNNVKKCIKPNGKIGKLYYFCDFFLDILFVWYLYENFGYNNESIQLSNCLIKWCKLTCTIWILKPKAMRTCKF
jgi:hypothetical protein